MATSKGRSDVSRYIANIPGALERLLRGAGRAGANVIAEEAKQRSISSEVSGAIRVSTSVKEGMVTARIQVKGPGSYIAPWLEYGTDPHFISVDDSQRQGMSIGRVNKKVKDGSLVINGKFVGATIFHPGAKAHPFLRPALDMKEVDAVVAAQAYINARVSPKGIASGDPQSADE